MTAGSVLIAGCGDLGERLGHLLLAAGRPVIGLRRDPSRLAPGLIPLAADLGDPASLARIPAGLTQVVYSVSADAFTDEAYRGAYRDGLRNLLAAVGPLDRLIFVSSTSVFTQDDGSWVNESSPAEPSSFSTKRLLEGEALAREAGGVVLRLAGLYGPGRSRLLESVRGGEATYDPTREEWTNRIHADCAARALGLLLDLEEPEPLYLAVDDEPAERRVVLDWLASRLGAPAPRAAAPAEGGRSRPRSSKRCSNRLLRAAGWRPAYPSWREGYETLL